jgi:hypothetical protein
MPWDSAKWTAASSVMACLASQAEVKAASPRAVLLGITLMPRIRNWKGSAHETGNIGFFRAFGEWAPGKPTHQYKEVCLLLPSCLV